MQSVKTMTEVSKSRATLPATFIIMVLFCSHLAAIGQPGDTTQQTVNKKRLRTFTIASTAGYGLTLVGLSQLWYKDSEQQSFRFFNDNAEWKQVDKLGHFTSSFYFSYGTQRALRWCGVSPRKADLIGAVSGFMVLLPIEILDGFSASYGASTGDLMANAGGSALFLGQQALWNEIRIYPKFSFQSTRYAAMRPNVLGDNSVSEILKDYNGQTYWLSVDMDKFIKFPKWLNLAAGYGAHNMIYARDYQNAEIGLEAKRQYYLALDFDLTAIKTRSKALNTLIFIVNIIKLPAPTLEFSKTGTRLHAAYF